MSDKLSSRDVCFLPFIDCSEILGSTSDTDACVDSDTQQTNGKSPSPSFLPPALCLSLDFKDLALIFHPQLMHE